MALLLTREITRSFQFAGLQLREVTQSWLRRAKPAEVEEAVAPSHVFTHLHKSGEMNHLGHYHCDACGAEMRLAPVGTEEAHAPARYRWKCTGCGTLDDTSFRQCQCGRQTVMDKHAASGRSLPVSLNAGGCTHCERCVVCDGILAIGNLMWFYGRWTDFYPVTEHDGETSQDYTVTRERSKFYGFHCHYSCAEKNPAAIERVREQRTPDWYADGVAEQQRHETERLRAEGRCLLCKSPLDLVTRLRKLESHPWCR